MKKIIIIFLFYLSQLTCTSQVYLYEPGTILLDKREGEVMWGQSKNGEKGCSPSYNYFCPTDDDESQCGHTLAGCAAVAMAQIIIDGAIQRNRCTTHTTGIGFLLF